MAQRVASVSHRSESTNFNRQSPFKSVEPFKIAFYQHVLVKENGFLEFQMASLYNSIHGIKRQNENF